MNLPRTARILPILALAMSGCSSTSTLIADKQIMVSPGLQISHQALVGAAAAGALVWYVTDPLAPTWKIESRKLSENRYRIDLRQKRFAVGGDGEAWQSFRRTAEALLREHGHDAYTVTEYSEGFESATPIGQRVASGVVLLTYRED